jgi:hypothetical protein
MMAKLWTMNGLSVELRVDRRKLGEVLSAVPPDGQVQGTSAWRMSTAVAALSASMAEPKGDPDYNRERTRLAKAQADKTEMENAVARRELLPAEDVAAADEIIFAGLRDRVLQVASVAPLLHDAAVSEAGLPKVRELLRQALVDALEDVGTAELVPAEADADGAAA